MPTILARVDREYGQYSNSAASSAGVGWVTAGVHILEQACADPRSVYRRQAEEIRARGNTPSAAEELGAVLARLKADIQAGLLGDLEDRVTGETYDDLLDHAQVYVDEGRKDPAAVLAGVVIEDTIRRICRIHSLEKTDLEQCINALTSNHILTKLEGKEAKTAAGLRNHAVHSQWDAFKADQIPPVIQLAQRLIREHLAT